MTRPSWPDTAHWLLELAVPPTPPVSSAPHVPNNSRPAAEPSAESNACIGTRSTDVHVFDAFCSAIYRWASTFGLSPLLLATVLEHEGFGFWQLYRSPFGMLARYAEYKGIVMSSVGIGGIDPITALYRVSLFSGVDLSLDETRRMLVFDDGFSIMVAALNLSSFQAMYGLTDRQAFQAYAFSDELIRQMALLYDFDKFSESKSRGNRWDVLSQKVADASGF